MIKTEIISEIKAIIAEHGSFTTADVEAQSSPCINSIGSDVVEVAESFYSDRVEATIYAHGMDVAFSSYLYEELKMDVLLEILVLAKTYKEIQC